MKASRLVLSLTFFLFLVDLVEGISLIKTYAIWDCNAKTENGLTNIFPIANTALVNPPTSAKTSNKPLVVMNI